MLKSLATAHASINQSVLCRKREADNYETEAIKHDLQVCMKCEYKVHCKRFVITFSLIGEQGRQIRSKSRMRSLPLLSFLVLLAVLSLSMANHKPDHDTKTVAPIIDLRGKRLRRASSARCPSNCCRKRLEMPKRWRECQESKGCQGSQGCRGDEFCAYNIDFARPPFSDCISI